MAIKYKDKELTTLEDIQKLTVKELRDNLKCNSGRAGGNAEIKRKSFSRTGAKQWNEIPTKLRALPKATFTKKIQMILLKILENEESYKDLEFMISKVKFHSSYLEYGG